MKWQDLVIAAAQVFFIIATIPSIKSQDKPALMTSAMNLTLVWIVAATQLTLQLWFSAITAFAIGVCHLTLTIQKAKMNAALKNAGGRD